MIHNGMRPVHPGEILHEEFLKPLGLSVNALALALRVPATRLPAARCPSASVRPACQAIFHQAFRETLAALFRPNTLLHRFPQNPA